METSDDDSSSLETSFSEDDSKTENNAQNINRRNDNLTDVSDYEDVTKNNISPRTNKQVKNSVVMSPSSSNDKKFNEQNKQHINRTSPRRCNLQKVIKYNYDVEEEDLNDFNTNDKKLVDQSIKIEKGVNNEEEVSKKTVKKKTPILPPKPNFTSLFNEKSNKRRVPVHFQDIIEGSQFDWAMKLLNEAGEKNIEKNMIFYNNYYSNSPKNETIIFKIKNNQTKKIIKVVSDKESYYLKSNNLESDGELDDNDSLGILEVNDLKMNKDSHSEFKSNPSKQDIQIINENSPINNLQNKEIQTNKNAHCLTANNQFNNELNADLTINPNIQQLNQNQNTPQFSSLINVNSNEQQLHFNLNRNLNSLTSSKPIQQPTNQNINFNPISYPSSYPQNYISPFVYQNAPSYFIPPLSQNNQQFFGNIHEPIIINQSNSSNLSSSTTINHYINNLNNILNPSQLIPFPRNYQNATQMYNSLPMSQTPLQTNTQNFKASMIPQSNPQINSNTNFSFSQENKQIYPPVSNPNAQQLTNTSHVQSVNSIPSFIASSTTNSSNNPSTTSGFKIGRNIFVPVKKVNDNPPK